MNRPSMLANLKAAQTYGKACQAAARAGQGGLFDASPDALAPPVGIELPDWDIDTKLAFEREALGANITGHPVLQLDPKYRAFATHQCGDYERMLHAREECRLVVMVATLRVLPRIAFLSVEDETGLIEVIGFKDDVDRCYWAIQPNMLVGMRVKARHDPTRGPALMLTGAKKLGHFATAADIRERRKYAVKA